MNEGQPHSPCDVAPLSSSPPGVRTPPHRPTPAHPLAECVPLLPVDEYEHLVDEIRRQGLDKPILRFEGQILDGVDSEKACIELGIEPIYEDFEGDWDAAVERVRSRLDYRLLTASRRVAISQKLTEAAKIGRPERRPEGPISGPAENIRKETAQGVGVSEQSAKQTTAVAPEARIPAQTIADGTVSVNGAPQGQAPKRVGTENKTPTSSGIKAFDDAKITKHLAKLVGMIEERAKVHGKPIEYRGLTDRINEVFRRWASWQIETR
jgi:hypothetical protein